MGENSKPRLLAPGGSWESLKRIIRAYHAVENNENPTVEEVARIAGVQRPVVSSSNNFLRSMGILQDGTNKLTQLGARLATGLGINNQSLVSSALQEIVRSQEGLAYLVSLLRARSTMTVEAFKGEIVIVTGLDENSRNLPFLKGVVDILQESLIVKVENDEITYLGTHLNDMAVNLPSTPTVAPTTPPQTLRMVTDRTIPIPLGVGRLVHVELPEDWSSKDLPKLLRMLELSLSDGETP